MTGPRAILLDFDGTITTKDTINTLFGQALSLQQADFTQALQVILSTYSEDLAQHVRKYRPQEEARVDLRQEIEYYRSLKVIELRSFDRVITSSIFRGISPEKWFSVGQNVVRDGLVVVRDGFAEFLDRMEEKNIKVGIVSVNFSRDFIRGVLASSASQQIGNLQIVSNWTDGQGRIVGPDGEHGDVLATSDDKMGAMNKLLNEWELNHHRVVYVGDSGTDIECLTRDGVTGIVMTKNRESKLMHMLERVSLEVAPIEIYKEDRRRSLYWAMDFVSILRSLEHKCSLVPQSSTEG